MKKKLFALMLAGILTLSGCSFSDLYPFAPTESPAVSTDSHSVSEEINLLNTEPPEAPTFQTPLVTVQAGIQLWAREQLSPAVQDTYDRLDAAIACHQETAVEVEASMEDVQLALSALRIDHPEYFWFDGQAAYVSTTTLLGETVSCELSYSMTMAEAQDKLQQVEQYVSACLSSPEVAGAQSDYDKILAVYRYIINHTDYVLSETDQSFLSVMTRGQGTCAGYARCFQYLMHRLNIPCTLALGYGDSRESHGWNVVFCGGQWYHIDVTWGDPVDTDGNPGVSLEYTYCMLTDEEIFRNHIPDGVIPIPECTATEYNYYRKSGLQMTSWDSAKYEKLMRTALEREEDWLTVRFDRQEDFDAAMNALIGNSGIMTIFSNCGIPIPADGVTYSPNDTFYEFSVKIS